MDNLPDCLIIEILSRLNDTTELTRCKCLSKSLNRLAGQVRSIDLYCSLDRFTKTMSPADARWKFIPFKTIFHKLISDAQVPIESVSLGIDKSLDSFDDYDCEFEEECDDLFLTDGLFCVDWLTKIGNGLKSISISSWSRHSRRNQKFFDDKETNILDVISDNCHSLVELTLNNSALCGDDMHQMPLLTRLTLKDVRIGDWHLSKLMECLPCLEVLNWINDPRDAHPKIDHLNLKELKWTVSEIAFPVDESSLTIYAPNLTKLELECDDKSKVSVHAPLLSYFHLNPPSGGELNVEKFENLKTLWIVSNELRYILANFPSAAVQNLTFESLGLGSAPLPHDKRIDLSIVFTIFPNVTSLTLGSKVWSRMLYPVEPSSLVAKGLSVGLKQITIYLVPGDIDKTLTFILYAKDICSNLTDIVLFFHFDVDLSVSRSFVSLCMSLCPKVRFRRGTWKEGSEDYICFSNNIVSAANSV